MILFFCFAKNVSEDLFHTKLTHKLTYFYKIKQDIGFSDALNPCHYGGVERI